MESSIEKKTAKRIKLTDFFTRTLPPKKDENDSALAIPAGKAICKKINAYIILPFCYAISASPAQQSMRHLSEPPTGSASSGNRLNDGRYSVKYLKTYFYYRIYIPRSEQED